MSTIKVDTIATRTGSGNITLSNNVASLTSAGAISGTNITASGTLAVTGDATFDTSTLKVDASNNKVGIGTTSPNAKLAVSGTGTVDLGIGSTNAGGAYLYLDGDSNGDFSGSDYSYIAHDTSGQLLIHQDSPSGSDNIILKTNGSTRWTLNSSGNLFPAATSQGIVLGATSDTAANRLDDYEEGTFGPAMTLTTPGNSSFTTQAVSGQYRKVGNIVTFTMELRMDTVTYGTGSGTPVITGFPFNFANTGGYGSSLCVVSHYGTAIASGRIPLAGGVSNTTNLHLYTMGNSSATAAMVISNYNTIQVSGTYITP